MDFYRVMTEELAVAAITELSVLLIGRRRASFRPTVVRLAIVRHVAMHAPRELGLRAAVNRRFLVRMRRCRRSVMMVVET